MDLKALMQKLETIDKKEILTEAEKKETTWTDKSGKKHPATQVKGDKYTGKEAEKEAKPKKGDLEEGFTSAIARALVEEFGYEIDEATPPIPTAEKMADGGPPPTPEQLKWLGGADKTDPIILARMRKAVPNAPAAPAAPAAPTGTTAQGDDEGNTMITKPDGTTMVVGPDGNAIKPGSNPNLPQNKPASTAMTAADQDDADMGAAMRANAAGGNSTSAATGVGNPGEEAAAQAAKDKANGVNAAGQNVTMPGGINPETGEKTTTTAGAPAAGGQAASPAKPAAAKPGFKADPLGQSIANQLKMTTPDAIKLFQKNNGLQADGMIGPATTKALQAAAQKMGLTVASGVGTSTAGGGRGGQGGPTAAQMAQATPAAGQAASPAANPEAAKIDAEIKRFSSKNNMSLQANKDYVAGLEKKKAAATGGTTQTPAQQAVAKDIGSFAGESINYAEDQILLRIKSLAGL